MNSTISHAIKPYIQPITKPLSLSGPSVDVLNRTHTHSYTHFCNGSRFGSWRITLSRTLTHTHTLFLTRTEAAHATCVSGESTRTHSHTLTHAFYVRRNWHQLCVEPQIVNCGLWRRETVIKTSSIYLLFYFPKNILSFFCFCFTRFTLNKHIVTLKVNKKEKLYVKKEWIKKSVALINCLIDTLLSVKLLTTFFLVFATLLLCFLPQVFLWLRYNLWELC